jgi:hypothetical protein
LLTAAFPAKRHSAPGSVDRRSRVGVQKLTRWAMMASGR